MTRLFIAGLDTETNSFSPVPTDEAAFRETLLAFGDATSRPLNSCSVQLALWRRHGEAIGKVVTEGPCAVAEPGGPIVKSFYQAFRERFLDDLRAARPDIVLLALHGAAMAEGCDDVEGDLLQRARALLGPQVFIGATLDPHAHLTERMIANADTLIAYKEYPHTDISARAADLIELAIAAHAGVVRPAMAMWDCRMIATLPTQAEPMRSFVDALIEAERSTPRLLSLSLIHGFAHGDHPEAGVRMLAVTDADHTLAAALAETYGRRLVALRETVTPRFIDMATALALLAEAPSGAGPMVLADAGDNPGGGAPGDATYLLEMCLDRGLNGLAFAIFHDPAVVARCREAGVGTRLDVQLGGGFAGMSGRPVALRGATVMAVGHAMRQRFGDVLLPMGDAVRLRVDGIDIVVSDHRTQVFDPVCLTGLGAHPAAYRAIIVKSLNHFAALFAPVARAIAYAATPGATSPSCATIPYRRRAPDYWPRIADPWTR